MPAAASRSSCGRSRKVAPLLQPWTDTSPVPRRFRRRSLRPNAHWWSDCPSRVERVRRAKIVCTLGPATSTAERIEALVDAGMDVARLNLSHGSYDDHEKVYLSVRKAADATGHGVGVLVDLQGPKIRLGRFAAGAVDLVEGNAFTITTRSVSGDADVASTTYAGLPGDVTA